MKTFTSLRVRWEVPTEVTGLVLGTLTEIERLRPIVEAAEAITDATSGRERSDAVMRLIHAVADAREELGQ